jgi:hypothetical protein
VLRVAQRLLLRAKAAVAVVGPEVPEESLMRLLEAGG